jgi:GNAT superfamily N-acetyltransferase
MTALAANMPQPNTSVTVRSARAEDCETILRMIRALAHFQGIGSRVTAKLESAGRPVGLAMFQLNYSIWEGACSLQITDLFVDELARGTGVGFRLVIEVARIARERDCSGLQLNMVHANPSRMSLDRMGFVHQDDLLHYTLDSGALKKLLEMDR